MMYIIHENNIVQCYNRQSLTAVPFLSFIYINRRVFIVNHCDPLDFRFESRPGR